MMNCTIFSASAVLNLFLELSHVVSRFKGVHKCVSALLECIVQFPPKTLCGAGRPLFLVPAWSST
eukprot:2691692-Rhodomonas_salina.1